jgi:lipoate-protein ligase A
MGTDLALLEVASETTGPAIVRTYTWSEPTLSLGYFQAAAEAAAEPRWRGVELVRRPTGGGAIWHDRELTYSVILPRTHPAAARVETLYRVVHTAIVGTLESSGVRLARRGGSHGGIVRSRPFLCFLDADPEDLVIGPHKVVGSAQKRRPGAVLQHGSILLGASPRTPELPGIEDLGGPCRPAAEWSADVAAAICRALELDPEPCGLTPEETARAAALESEPFRTAGWTFKR